MGAPMPHWLARATEPTMVARSSLARRKADVPRSAVPWYLDSAAFTELDAHGCWTVTAREWARQARGWADQAGSCVAVAVQDWLCTPPALARTGSTVAEHQALTLASWRDLAELDATLPWVPTLQGWTPDDYLRHADAYTAAGCDLAAAPMVGVGSIALRQHTPAAAAIVTGLARAGLGNLHAYGAKQVGLASWGWAVASADSMAWSTTARREGLRLPACTHAGPDCRNCQRWAEQWGARMAGLVGAGEAPLVLFA